MKENSCYYDGTTSHFFTIIVALWIDAIALLIDFLPLVIRVLLCLLVLFLVLFGIWSAPYGCILTDQDVTLTIGKRIVSVTPWEQVHWKVARVRGFNISLVDENGKEYPLATDAFWLMQAFFICCPNPPVTENYYNPNLEDPFPFRWWKLGKKHILSSRQVKLRRIWSILLYGLVGLCATYFFLGESILFEIDDLPEFLYVLWLFSMIIDLVPLFAAIHLEDTVKRSFAAAVYQKKQHIVPPYTLLH